MPEPAPRAASPEQKRSQTPGDAPRLDPEAKPWKGRQSALFHTLLEAGFTPVVAYTAERQMQAMTSETAAAQIQAAVAEIRQLREDMVTKADLAASETRMVKWMFGALMAQGAFIVAVIKLLG